MSLFQDIVWKNESTSDRVAEKASQYAIIDNGYGGLAVKSSYDNTVTQGMIKSIANFLVPITRSAVRDLDSIDDLKFIRIMTKKYELLVGVEHEFTIVVQQHRT